MPTNYHTIPYQYHHTIPLYHPYIISTLSTHNTTYTVKPCRGRFVPTAGRRSRSIRRAKSIATCAAIVPTWPNSTNCPVEPHIPCRVPHLFGPRVTKNNKRYGNPRNPCAPRLRSHVLSVDTPKWGTIRSNCARSMKGKRYFTNVPLASTPGASITNIY